MQKALQIIEYNYKKNTNRKFSNLNQKSSVKRKD